MNLFKASRQWAERPDDERFSTLKELFDATIAYRQKAVEATVPRQSLRVEGSNGEVLLVGEKEKARISHWAFSQLSNKASAPADYLRKLPTELAVTNLNHGLEQISEEKQAQLMFHRNGGLLLRSLTSEIYTRIWNHEIASRLLKLGEDWRVPPARPARQGQAGSRPATEADVLGASAFELSISIGDLIAPAGLYASDHDMFVFMVNEANRIEDGTPGGLSRGFFVWNSEVGGVSFGVMCFLYQHVCGNHIVWNAKHVHEIRIRHVGSADSRVFRELTVELHKYSEQSGEQDKQLIMSAKAKELGKTKDEVLDKIFSMRIPHLSRKALTTSYDLAERHVDLNGSPRTVWGMVQGITRASQEMEYADKRVAMDQAASKVMKIAF